MRRRLWIAVGAAVVLLGAGTFYLMLPEYAGEPARPARCRSNLKYIGMSFRLYARDHGDSFPPVLGHLYPDPIEDGNIFWCPSGGRATPITEADLHEGARDASDVFGEHNSDYDYVSGLSRANDPPGLVLAHDKDGNHEGGRNVLFIGGNVEWMKEEEFQAALAKTREYLKARR